MQRFDIHDDPFGAATEYRFGIIDPEERLNWDKISPIFCAHLADASSFDYEFFRKESKRDAQGRSSGGTQPRRAGPRSAARVR
ncbi:hypothetical protein [Sphingomonas colocasiae]|uniref:Uncharacterized protein n=1 Tax=Sphingomonas colocasiae TaxID=1848973 RepID=A0ABS7PYH4_9SPHN|nr:hypothetical protein [Sphingomonas colocasiae]MBY8826248.1 hypothetical protein [Sphingomonas colocasiae]